jgi:hypothetical protein
MHEALHIHWPCRRPPIERSLLGTSRTTSNGDYVQREFATIQLSRQQRWSRRLPKRLTWYNHSSIICWLLARKEKKKRLWQNHIWWGQHSWMVHRCCHHSSNPVLVQDQFINVYMLDCWRHYSCDCMGHRLWYGRRLRHIKNLTFIWNLRADPVLMKIDWNRKEKQKTCWRRFEKNRM